MKLQSALLQINFLPITQFCNIYSLTVRLLMSYIYMEFLVKPEMLNSYIYGPTFGNAEAVSFYLLHNVSTLYRCRVIFADTVMCNQFASYQGYAN